MRLEERNHGKNQHNLLDKSDNIQANRQRGRLERQRFESRFILEITQEKIQWQIQTELPGVY